MKRHYQLRQLRRAAGWNVITAATRAGVSTTTINNIEAGRPGVSKKRLAAYSKLVKRAALERRLRIEAMRD